MRSIFKNIIFGVIFSLLAGTSCFAQKLQGTYVQDDMDNIKLHFSEDLFFFQDDFDYTHMPPYNCSDTLAFGYWERDEKTPFIKLFTNPIQHASLINISVDESKRGNTDSIFFIIRNPIEDDFIKHNEGNENARQIFYTLIIETGDNQYDTRVNFENYYTNTIAFDLPKTKKVKSFEVTINPIDCVLGWRDNMLPHPITTLQYEVKEDSSNVFNIDLPELTYCYLSTLRLNGDFVKILNKTQIEWDGHIYTKK